MGENAFNFPYTLSSKPKVIKFINKTDYSIRGASAIFHTPDSSIVRMEEKKEIIEKHPLNRSIPSNRKCYLKSCDP